MQFHFHNRDPHFLSKHACKAGHPSTHFSESLFLHQGSACSLNSKCFDVAFFAVPDPQQVPRHLFQIQVSRRVEEVIERVGASLSLASASQTTIQQVLNRRVAGNYEIGVMIMIRELLYKYLSDFGLSNSIFVFN